MTDQTAHVANIVEELRGLIGRVAKSRGIEGCDIDDFVQEVHVKCLGRARSKPDLDWGPNLVMHIAKYATQDFRRSRARRFDLRKCMSLHDTDVEQRHQATGSAGLERIDVGVLMCYLRPRAARILQQRLRWIPLAEIAAAERMTVSGVSHSLQRSCAKLRAVRNVQ